MCWDNNLYSEEETSKAPHMIEPRDYTKWELVDRLGNKFNRLVMYRSDNYHVSMDYFGQICMMVDYFKFSFLLQIIKHFINI